MRNAAAETLKEIFRISLFFPHLDERKIYYLNFQFRNECTVVKKKIKKYSPETTCEKIPTELCAPPGCGFKEVTWIPNHGNYVTSVSLNMAIMWPVCPWTWQLCDQCVPEHGNYVTSVSLNMAIMWPVCPWTLQLCDQCVPKHDNYVTSVSLNMAIMWPVCPWTWQLGDQCVPNHVNYVTSGSLIMSIMWPVDP